MKAPFPWFGGKRRIAAEIWAAFGDVDNYIEPFAGSLACLLGRPSTHRGIVAGAETVNDMDRHLANFWRALSVDPEGVAKWADSPVNEADLVARHLWLVNTGAERIAAIESDPDHFDAKVAGWWLWGICSWIGSGWCSGKGPHTLGNAGQGVNRKLPHLGDAGRGVNRQLPHLGNAGQGVNRQLPHLGNDDSDVFTYMRALQARLRRVRVCCGDWQRVVTDGAMSYGSKVGVLLDPPYSTDHRESGLYASDDGDVAALVRAWAIEHGENRRLRIALCGYEGEHDMPSSWRKLAWKSSGAYVGKGEAGAANRHKERVWFSPGCLAPAALSLFP